MKVLIAEDSVTSRMMLTATVKKWGFDVSEVEDGLDAWEIMQHHDHPNLLIVDWEMPNMDGIELCKKIRSKNSQNPPYIILLTGRTESKYIVEGLESGANDYVPKPFNTAELQARIQVGKRVLEMQETLNDTLEALRISATHDSLTGILNRGAVLDALVKEIKRVERQKRVLCVGMCDVDNFKSINDTYGHLVGDDVLKEITKRMEKALRVYDLIGRYGGEEFLVVVNTTDDNLLEVYERICVDVAKEPVLSGNIFIDVSISCGVAKFDTNADDVRTLLVRADAALYQAKENGKNQVVYT